MTGQSFFYMFTTYPQRKTSKIAINKVIHRVIHKIHRNSHDVCAKKVTKKTKQLFCEKNIKIVDEEKNDEKALTKSDSKIP